MKINPNYFSTLLICNLTYSQINIELERRAKHPTGLLSDRQKLNYADKYFSNQDYFIC
jgi:hypothetical protein